MPSIAIRTFDKLKSVFRTAPTVTTMPKMPKITKYNLSTNCYIQKAQTKTAIIVHHTAGNANPRAVVDGYAQRKDKVATPYVIGGKPYGTNPDWVDGEIIQCFPENQCSYHLGLAQKHFTPFGLPYKELNFSSIPIEICNWGYVTKDANGLFRTYVNTIVTADEVIELDKEYKGFKFWHKYTDAQLLSLRELLIYLCAQYKIPTTYHPSMFEVNKEALSGVEGNWTHTSYRTDKVDCSPQPNLIRVLQSLNSI